MLLNIYTETYTVLLQSDSSYKYDISKVARKNNGEGTETEAEAYIQKFDVEKVLDDIRLLLFKKENQALS